MDKVKLLVKMGLVVLICFGLNFIFNDDIHSYTRVMFDDLYHGDNVDVVFVGGSHVFLAIDPEIADSILDVNTFDASSSMQQMDGSYHILKEVGENHEVKTVFFDTYFVNGQAEDTGDKELYILSDHMQNNSNKLEYLWSARGINGLVNNILPMVHSHTLGSPVSLLKAKFADAYDLGNYSYVQYESEAYRGKGFVYSFENANEDTDFTIDTTIDPEKPMSDFAYKYLEAITAYCKENDIELILTSSPIPDASLSEVEHYEAYIDFMQEYADENGLRYWNFNLSRHELLTMEMEDYRDSNHLSGIGAEKYTEVFCNLYNDIKSGEVTEEDVFYTEYAEKLAGNPDGTASLK